jgi:thioester reductase-like protein
MPTHNLFITGGTGYMGQRLIARLLTAGRLVTALVRPDSTASAVPPGS